MTDYTSDAPPMDAQPKTGQPEETKPDSNDRTALLPIAFFEGKEVKPGTVCSVKIDRVEEDQVEVSYVSDQEEESSEPPKESAPEQEQASVPPDMMG